MSIRTDTPPTFAASIAGRYTIIRELGRGGMATVYLAKDSESGREVAVKLLHPDLAASIGGERFLREIELGQLLRHERIVSVLTSGEAAGQLYYVMPYVAGESLRDRLDRVKQLTIDETLAITKQVAEALDYAHSKDVVHRDIKPENIMLSGDQAYVMDFGIAHAVTTAGGEKLTKTGMAVGTPAYMSPEQAVGAKDVTGQSDIYSLGCVVYEMLAGEPPFAGANAMALLAKHSLESVPSIRVVRQSVPPELEDAIFCSLEKTPVDRFKSAGDFAKALAGELPVPKHTRQRTGAGATVPQRAPRSKLPLIAAGVALLAAVAGGGWWYTHRDAGLQQRIGSETDPRKIAVLYFEDGSPKKDLSFVTDGLTEALIHELGQVDSLTVISRNGVASLKGKVVPPDSVGKLFKVGTVVTGKLSQAGEDLRVEVSLVDASNNQEIGSARLDQPRDSVVALQDALAKRVADVLRQKLGQELASSAQRSGTRNAKAWEALQRSKQTMTAAVELARENAQAASTQYLAADVELAAVEKLDDKWTEPATQRAWVAYQQARLAPRVDPAKLGEFVAKGIEHAERALKIRAQDPDALEARGTLRYWGWLSGVATDPTEASRLITGAEADLKAATAANPQQAGAWNTLSHMMLGKAKPSAAKTAADRAYQADPYLVNVEQTIWRRFQAALDLGIRTEAVKACDDGRTRFPEFYRFTECRLWLHAMKGAKPAADSVWKEYEALMASAIPDRAKEFMSYKGKMMVALGLVRAGLPDSARRVAETAQRAVPADPESELLFLLAVVHAQIDTPESRTEAIRTLGRFMAASPQRSTASDGADETWWFDSVKSDPRYKALTGG